MKWFLSLVIPDKTLISWRLLETYETSPRQENVCLDQFSMSFNLIYLFNNDKIIIPVFQNTQITIWFASFTFNPNLWMRFRNISGVNFSGTKSSEAYIYAPLMSLSNKVFSFSLGNRKSHRRKILSLVYNGNLGCVTTF